MTRFASDDLLAGQGGRPSNRWCPNQRSRDGPVSSRNDQWIIMQESTCHWNTRAFALWTLLVQTDIRKSSRAGLCRPLLRCTIWKPLPI